METNVDHKKLAHLHRDKIINHTFGRSFTNINREINKEKIYYVIHVASYLYTHQLFNRAKKNSKGNSYFAEFAEEIKPRIEEEFHKLDGRILTGDDLIVWFDTIESDLDKQYLGND